MRRLRVLGLKFSCFDNAEGGSDNRRQLDKQYKLARKLTGKTEEVSSMTTDLFLILMPKDESLKSYGRNQRMIELYQSGLSMREVGLEFGMSGQRVEQILKKAGIETRRYTRSNRLFEARKSKRKVISKELLLELYKDEELSVFEIIKKLGVSYVSFYKSLKYHNIPKRKTQGIHYSALTEEILRRLYLEEGLTAREIAQKLGFAAITVKKRLSKFGIRR